MAKRHQLRADLKDEQKAIRVYGARMKAKPPHGPMYREMQADEKDHAKKLTRALNHFGQRAAVGKR